MSLYGTKIKIDGIPCGLVMRGIANGSYQAVFEREYATLEQLEAINWAQPSILGDCPLPTGYGFTVSDIKYSASTKCYTVYLNTAKQFLGDVTGYVAQLEEMEDTVATQRKEIAALQDQLAEADETAIELYEALAATMYAADVIDAMEETQEDEPMDEPEDKPENEQDEKGDVAE